MYKNKLLIIFNFSNSSGIDFNVQKNSINGANRNIEHRRNEIVLK